MAPTEVHTTTTTPSAGMAPTRATASRLPDEWAAELERANDAKGIIPINNNFDSRLDRFLERFHSEITSARRLKEQLDAGSDVPEGARSALRSHIGEIHRLLAGEGRDFVDGLERREPALALAQQGAGANTLELAHGIERLESAVKAEEAERRRRKPSLPNIGIIASSYGDPYNSNNINRQRQLRENSFEAGTPHPLGNDGKTLPAGASVPVALALPNLHSDDTLQLMQSDIQALKLELMRLQRAKSNAILPMSGSSSITLSPDYTTTSPKLNMNNNNNNNNGINVYNSTSNSNIRNKQKHTTTTSSSNNINNLSSKKSQAIGSSLQSKISNLPLLPPRPPTHAVQTSVSGITSTGMNINSTSTTLRKMSGLNVTRVGGKPASLAPSYVSHLEEMKSRLDALEKKPLSRAARRKSHARLGRTRTMGSLYDTPALSVALDENSNPNVSSIKTPPRGIIDGSVGGTNNNNTANSNNLRTPGSCDRNGNGNNNNRGSLHSTPSPAGMRGAGSRLFIDGPEELLKRPQSQAATRDMQRYSLKVARRFGVDVNQKMLQLSSNTSPPPAIPAHVVEPRSKSAVAHSPRKRLSGLGLPPPNHTATLSSLASAPNTKKNNNNVSHNNNTNNTNSVHSCDTTSISGGRVVEELEGDLLVRKGVLWKRWRRRYASMVSHQFFGRVLCLFSYDISGGVNSTRSQIIVLRDGICKALRTAVDVNGIERFPFVLRTAAKEYYFAADSDDQRRKWVSELREAAEAEAARNNSNNNIPLNNSSRLHAPSSHGAFHL